jgi:hypothetical protein
MRVYHFDTVYNLYSQIQVLTAGLSQSMKMEIIPFCDIVVFWVSDTA